MPRNQDSSNRERGKNYNNTDDRILIELVIEHAEEVGLFDSQNTSWKGRISRSMVINNNDVTF